MAGVDHIPDDIILPDDILRNILSRLPAKPMGQCRCVSTHWNLLISAPSFMMSRSSSRIFLLLIGSERDSHVHIFVESNGSVTNSDFSMFKNIPSMRNWDDRFLTIVGTFSGIVLLTVMDYIAWDWERNGFVDERMILYNPFTGVYEIFRDPYSPLRADCHGYGFGYGATPDELKFVRLGNFILSKRSYHTCDVFNLKTRSWSQQELIQDTKIFAGTVGTFNKGYLYWLGPLKMMALNVDKMVFSEMHLPDSAINQSNHLGTCHGCLWMITNTKDTLKFDVWVKNEQGVDNLWSISCSFTLGMEPEWSFDKYEKIEITEDGKIIMNLEKGRVGQMIIYDTSTQSYKLLKRSSNCLRGIKYKESLTSPMNICRV